MQIVGAVVVEQIEVVDASTDVELDPEHNSTESERKRLRHNTVASPSPNPTKTPIHIFNIEGHVACDAMKRTILVGIDLRP